MCRHVPDQLRCRQPAEMSPDQPRCTRTRTDVSPLARPAEMSPASRDVARQTKMYNSQRRDVARPVEISSDQPKRRQMNKTPPDEP
ncbi:hypothetical protein LSAT2_010072 [Lamellibrachia satsuma]|nr:hypothetical protein LSAT2_010072 [Lamellibrachia satsuma]